MNRLSNDLGALGQWRAWRFAGLSKHAGILGSLRVGGANRNRGGHADAGATSPIVTPAPSTKSDTDTRPDADRDGALAAAARNAAGALGLGKVN